MTFFSCFSTRTSGTYAMRSRGRSKALSGKCTVNRATGTINEPGAVGPRSILKELEHQLKIIAKAYIKRNGIIVI